MIKILDIFPYYLQCPWGLGAAADATDGSLRGPEGTRHGPLTPGVPRHSNLPSPLACISLRDSSGSNILWKIHHSLFCIRCCLQIRQPSALKLSATPRCRVYPIFIQQRKSGPRDTVIAGRCPIQSHGTRVASVHVQLMQCMSRRRIRVEETSCEGRVEGLGDNEM